jgi:hypothetical protein
MCDTQGGLTASHADFSDVAKAKQHTLTERFSVPVKVSRTFRAIAIFGLGSNYTGCQTTFWDELKVERRTCEGFLAYEPGWSPSEHRDLLLKKHDRREKFVKLYGNASDELFDG